MRPVLCALVFALTISDALGGPEPSPSPNENQEQEEGWHGSISASTYLVLHGTDYVNPVIAADRDWLHLELRYNYEAIKTGSIWLGYNFHFGKELSLELTPMLGGVFGNSTGIAPGYSFAISYKQIELSSQGEYFIDAGDRAENFFYTWTELGWAPRDWFRVGLVIDRTRAFGSNFDIRRGPFVGFEYKKLAFTTYWLSPGSKDSALIFTVALNF